MGCGMATSWNLLCDRVENGCWQRRKEKDDFLEGEMGIRLLEQPGLLSMKMMGGCYGGRSRRRRDRDRSSANIAGYF